MRIPTLTLVALIVLAAPASASEMANITPSHYRLLERALTPAAAYWGKTPVCRPTLHEYDEQGEDRDFVTARADLGGCNVYWNRPVLLRVLNDARDRWRALAVQGLRDICTTTTHEYGHLLGYSHAPYGIMAEDGGLTSWDLVDGTHIEGGYLPECKRWARGIVKARAARARRRGARAVPGVLRVARPDPAP